MPSAQQLRSNGWPRQLAVGPAFERVGELDAVVGEHGVDFVLEGFDQFIEECPGSGGSRLLHQPSDGLLRGQVHGHEQVELAFLGPDLAMSIWK